MLNKIVKQVQESIINSLKKRMKKKMFQHMVCGMRKFSLYQQ